MFGLASLLKHLQRGPQGKGRLAVGASQQVHVKPTARKACVRVIHDSRGLQARFSIFSLVPRSKEASRTRRTGHRLSLLGRLQCFSAYEGRGRQLMADAAPFTFLVVCRSARGMGSTGHQTISTRSAASLLSFLNPFLISVFLWTETFAFEHAGLGWFWCGVLP